MNRLFTKMALAGAASLFLMSAPVMAETMKFKAALSGAEQVPPNDSAGKGTADVTVDSSAKKISWAVTYDGLSGDATAAHFHGPAAKGESAGPQIDISGMIDKGSADITDAQMADLEAGKMYLNIHTAKFPDGEIRGQVMK